MGAFYTTFPVGYPPIFKVGGLFVKTTEFNGCCAYIWEQCALKKKNKNQWVL